MTHEIAAAWVVNGGIFIGLAQQHGNRPGMTFLGVIMAVMGSLIGVMG